MDPFISLMILCFSMFIGSFIFGYLPLMISLSEKKMRLVTIFGAGVLVGTALIVIIPEGIHTIYAEAPEPLKYRTLMYDTTTFGPTPSQDEVWKAEEGWYDNVEIEGHQEEDHGHGSVHAETPILSSRSSDAGFVKPSRSGRQLQNEEEHDVSHHSHDHSHSHSHYSDSDSTTAAHDHSGENEHEHCMIPTSAHQHIGAALAFGFVFQLIVDWLNAGSGHGHSHGGGGAHQHGHGHEGHHHHHPTHEDDPQCKSSKVQRRDGSANDLVVEMLELSKTPSKRLVKAVPLSSSTTTTLSSASSSTSSVTYGLLVHAAVDGIALGAVSFADSGAVEAVVFLAIMLHKAPAAFGTSSFLLASGRSAKEVTSQIVIFSSAAPIAAILTYVCLGEGLFPADVAQEYMGLCLLFSAGSFLYVATVHVLPETLNGGGTLETIAMAFLVCGIILPLFISIEHSHGGGGHTH